MLPKLQQSSLAQSLRRDNPASLIQGTSFITKPRINLKIWLIVQIMNHINLGKISMLLKTLILLLEIFQISIFQRKKFKKEDINRTMNWLYLDLFISLKDWKEQVEKHRLLWRKNLSLKLHLLRAEPLKKDKSLLHNSEGIMTEQIYQLKLIIKAQHWNWSGKSQLKV